MSKCDKIHILFLRNVFKRDCIDVGDELEEKVLETINESDINIEANTYGSIPEIFVNVNDWPKKTNILCWYCDSQFETVPIFCPAYEYERTPGISVMKVIGNFCSFPCASKHNKSTTIEPHTWERQELLCRLYKKFYGEDINEIPLPPLKTEMIQWGGFMTRQQYNDSIALSMSKYEKTLKANSITSIEVNII